VSEPAVGDRYISKDNIGAAQALGLGVVPNGLMFVTVSHVYPEHRKVRVLDGELWLTFEELAEYFRRRQNA
jgi:hypothetical protein